MAVLGLIPILVLALIVIAVIVAVTRRSHLGGIVSSVDQAPRPPDVSVDAVRLLTYAVSFIGLMAVLFAIYGLLGLLLAESVFRARDLVSATDARQQASYFLAALIVGTPLWLGFWRMAQRRLARGPQERQAPERRLYFALVFAVASIVALFAFHTLLRVLLTLSGTHGADSAIKDGVGAAIRLVVYSAALVGYTRMAWRERSSDEPDPAHDFGVYTVTAFSLVFLAIGLVNAIAAIVDHLQGAHVTIVLGSTPGSVGATWGQIAAWIISGGVVWAAISRHDQSYPGVRSFRVAYLYLVLAVSVGLTLGFGGQLLYELIRRAFAYQPVDRWRFLHDVLPTLLVGAAVWAYYWIVLRRQAALARADAGPGAIPWPRRWPLAGLSFVGLAMAAPGAIALLWVGLDFLMKTHDLSSGSWWRDQTSTGIAVLLIGSAVWLPAWSILQRAASSDPEERAAQARRWLLGGITLIATLAAVGFTVAVLWRILGMVLGGSHDAATVGHALKYLSAAIVAGVLVAYHGTKLRRDVRSAVRRGGRLQVAALLAPDASAALEELKGRLGRQVEVLGYLTAPESGAVTPLPALAEQLVALDVSDVERVLLVLGPDGGTAYPFARHQVQPALGEPAEQNGQAHSASAEAVP